MAWNNIRKATEEDVTKLNSAAQKFAERHKLKLDGYAVETFGHSSALETELEYRKDATLRSQWKQIVRRTLDAKGADGIAYGYVGYHVD